MDRTDTGDQCHDDGTDRAELDLARGIINANIADGALQHGGWRGRAGIFAGS